MKNRNTKIALASVLAVSAIAPVAFAAEEAPAKQLVNLKYDNEMLTKYLPAQGELLERQGQLMISLTIADEYKEMIKEFKVNGKSIITTVPNVGTFYSIPVTADLKEVDGSVTMLAGGAERTAEFKLSFENVGGEKPTTSAPTQPTTPTVKAAELAYEAYYPIADGVYDVTFDAFNPKTGAGNYTPITGQLDSAAKLVVEDGKYFLEIQEKERKDAETGENVSWITEYQVKVNGEYVTAPFVKGELHDYPHVVRLPIADINGKTNAKLYVDAGAHKNWYEFDFAIDKGQKLPQAFPTYVYKEGTNELSIMHKTYLSTSSNVTFKENGKYAIDIKFPQGQYIESLKIDGQTVAASKSYEEKTTNSSGKEVTNTVRIYTVETDDLSKIFTATIDLNVPGVYKTAHDAEIQIGGKQNPFADVIKSFAYGNIVSLYSKGIFKEADKFNPTNELRRSHFALMLNRAFNLEVPETTKFTDIAKLPAEEQTAIKALNNYGIINGATETTFNPNGNIKRYEAALMIKRLLVNAGYEVNAGLTSNFTDLGSLNAEAKDAVAFLASQGIINGKGNNKFDPQGTLQRQEMAKILDKALKLIENK